MKTFVRNLNRILQRTKDISRNRMCVTALRISDIKRLKWEHVIRRDAVSYLNIASQKTGYENLIKLPDFALAIFKKYKGRRKQLLPVLLLCRLNKRIKRNL